MFHILTLKYKGKITRLEKEVQAAKEEKEKTEKAAEDGKKQSEENQQKMKL